MVDQSNPLSVEFGRVHIVRPSGVFQQHVKLGSKITASISNQTRSLSNDVDRRGICILQKYRYVANVEVPVTIV